MENKLGKYFTYALGEIVLVVIGILIALSINNWNQGRIESHKENTYFDNIEIDLKNQLASIDIQLTYEEKYVNLAIPILEQYKKKSEFIIDDVTSRALSELTERKTFVKVDPTYQDLISTGNIGLIKDQKVRNALIEYYIELERYEKIIQNNNSKLIDETYGTFIHRSVYLGSPNQKLFNISNNLLKDPKNEMLLINMIEFRERIASIHIEIMNQLKEKTTKTLRDFQNSRK